MNALHTISGFNYDAFSHNVKLIFLILTIILLGIALFSYIKVYLLVNSHHGHGDAHGGEHGAAGDHSAPAQGDEAGTDAHGETHAAGEHIPTNEPDIPMVGSPSNAAPYSEAWEAIQRNSESHRDADWKLSIIEADKLIDSALQQQGYPGETMGERLMLIKPDQLYSLQDLWDAHKLRNLVVHEANYQVRRDQVLAAMRAFEKVLRELGLL